MTVAAQAKLQSPAALAHERIYESVYVIHLRKARHVTSIDLIASYSEAENLDIQQHVQSELKEILRSFHESMFRSPLAKNYMAALRTSLDNHAAECLTFCCRAAGICKDMKKARKKAMGSKAKEEALQKGEIARSMSDILRLRSNEYAIKAAQKHARRCLRTCQKRYVKRCSSFLQFTRVWDDMLREISVPVVDAMCRTIEAELLQHDGFAGSDNGASIFEDARMHAEADFEKAVREWGISRTFGETKLEKVIAGAEQTTAPASNGVDDHLKNFIFCLLNTTMRREKKRLKPQLKLAREHLFQNQRVAKYRQNESERAARLTVDNDVLLYQINPQSGKRIMPSTRRAETDTGHYFTVLSGVTLPEQHGGGGLTGDGGRFDAEGDEGVVVAPWQGKAQASVATGAAGMSRRGLNDAPQSSAHGEGTSREVIHGFDRETPSIEDRYLAMRHKDCVAPYAGKRVVVHGLLTRPDLNMKTGQCLSFCERSGRYLVELDGNDGRRLKLQGIRLCGHMDDPRKGPCSVCSVQPAG